MIRVDALHHELAHAGGIRLAAHGLHDGTGGLQLAVADLLEHFGLSGQGHTDFDQDVRIHQKCAMRLPARRSGADDVQAEFARCHGETLVEGRHGGSR